MMQEIFLTKKSSLEIEEKIVSSECSLKKRKNEKVKRKMRDLKEFFTQSSQKTAERFISISFACS